MDADASGAGFLENEEEEEEWEQKAKRCVPLHSHPPHSKSKRQKDYGQKNETRISRISTKGSR
jgi:hypothetical protein